MLIILYPSERHNSESKTPEVRIKLNFDKDQLIVTKDFEDTNAFKTENSKSLKLLETPKMQKNKKRKASNSLNEKRNDMKEIENKSQRSLSNSSDKAQQRKQLLQKRGNFIRFMEFTLIFIGIR